MQLTIIYSFTFALICLLFFSICVGYELLFGDYIECSSNDNSSNIVNNNINNIQNNSDEYYHFPKKPVDAALKIVTQL